MTTPVAGSAHLPRSAIDVISDRFVVRFAALSPMTTTQLGIPGFDDQLDDLSPEGMAKANQLIEETVAELTAAEARDQRDALSRAVILERLVLRLEHFRTGWTHADLNVIESPVQLVRMVFDLMPTDTSKRSRSSCRRGCDASVRLPSAATKQAMPPWPLAAGRSWRFDRSTSARNSAPPMPVEARSRASSVPP